MRALLALLEELRGSEKVDCCALFSAELVRGVLLVLETGLDEATMRRLLPLVECAGRDCNGTS